MGEEMNVSEGPDWLDERIREDERQRIAWHLHSLASVVFKSGETYRALHDAASAIERSAYWRRPPSGTMPKLSDTVIPGREGAIK
jgi:hypothetical protein